MGTYRVYPLDAKGRITGPAQVVECETDQEAIQQIQRLLDTTPLEIWNDQRRIGRLEPDATLGLVPIAGTNYLPKC